MNDPLREPEARPELLSRLRALASRGTTVRELVTEVRSGLGYRGDAIVPVLWYLSQAFCVPLAIVLPIREWIGTDRDKEIDAVILPAVMSTRDQWDTPRDTSNGEVHPEKSPGLTAANQRS